MRAREFDPGGPIDPNSADQFKVGSANQMASMLAEWDIKAALPVLKARVDRCIRLVQAKQENGPRILGLEEGIASLTGLRTQAGDPEALDDYAAWIRTVTPDQFDAARADRDVRALVEQPRQPGRDRRAAAALFEDPKSPWNPSISSKSSRRGSGCSAICSAVALLGLKSFRSLVLRALADKTQVGTVEVDAHGTVTVIQGQHKTVEDRNTQDTLGQDLRRALAPDRESLQARAKGDAPAGGRPGLREPPGSSKAFPGSRSNGPWRSATTPSAPAWPT